MTKRSVFESSEGERSEVTYSLLTSRELDERIKSYEEKYSMPFSRYRRQFSCDEALPGEMSDFMDWQNLIEEKAQRRVQRRDNRLTRRKK